MAERVRRTRSRGRAGDGDRGFALMEFIVSVSIMGLIVGVLAAAVVVVLRNQENSSKRNDASNGALGLTNYFPVDVASTPPGGRETSKSLVTECAGYSNPGHNIVRLTWSETISGSTSTYRVAYRLISTADGGEVHRISCEKTSGSYGAAKDRTVAFALAKVPGTWLAGDAPAALTPLSGDGPLTLTLTAANGTLMNVQGTRMNPNSSLAAYEPPAPNAAMETAFTLSVANYSSVGQVLTYSVSISNTGSVPLTSVGSVLTNATAATACASALASGVTATCTATHTVTQADLDAGTITTSILAYGYYGLIAVSANASNTIAVAAAPAVSVLLSSASAGYSNIGDVISYTTTVTNTGNLTLSNLLSSYSNATEAAACTPVPLAPGQIATCTATHTIVAGEYGNPVETTASITGVTANLGNTEPTTSSAASVPFLANPQVAITAFSGSPTPVTTLGQIVTFSVTLTNTGNFALTSVAVAYTNSTEATSCASTLAIGASITCTSTHTVVQEDLDNGGFENSASASGFYFTSQATADATTTIAATAVPTVSVLLTSTESSFKYTGTVIHYTMVVKNTGSVAVSNLFTSWVNATAGSCSSSVLLVGASATCSATRTIVAADIGSDLAVSSSARAYSIFYGWSATQSGASTVSFVPEPKISVTSFTASPSPFTAVGQTVTFSVTLRNDGNVALTGVGVAHSNATSATSCATTLAAGGTTTCTATHTTTSGDVSTGVANTVTGTGSYGSTSTNGQSSLTVPVALPCTVTSSTTGTIASPTSAGRVTSNSDGKKDMLLADVAITITTTGSCTGLRVKYFPKTPSSVIADLVESPSGTWTYTIPGESHAAAAKWRTGAKQIQVLPAATVGNTPIYTHNSAFTVT